MKRKSKKIAPCFGDVFDAAKPYVIMDGGLRVIDKDRIVGTVGKCGQLDRKFRYFGRRDRAERSRRERILEGMEEYETFPPISVYLYEGNYYVEDGHRRVAACKALGIQYIDARVKEYVYKGDERNIESALTRRRFETETGLQNIDLRYELGYSVLYRGSAHYPSDKGVKMRAQMWYSSWFLPFCAEIKNSRLVKRYPDLAPEDIYVIVVGFYDDFMGGVPPAAGFDTLISGFMFTHSIRERPLRRGFFRILRVLIFRGRRR